MLSLVQVSHFLVAGIGLGWGELIILSLVALGSVGLGKLVARGLREDQRKIVGGVALLIGILLAICGISSLNSASSQLMGAMGRPDLGGGAALLFGALAAITGIVVIWSKGSSRAQQESSKKKCPFCAEVIQAEAKVCRFCGKAVETAGSTHAGLVGVRVPGPSKTPTLPPAGNFDHG